MKKLNLKKLLVPMTLVLMLLVMSFSLAACGGGETSDVNEADEVMESATLVEVNTEQGISLMLPSDLTLQENKGYANMETGENVMILSIASDGTPLSDYTEEDVLAIYQSSYKDIAIEDFATGVDINGNEGLIAVCSLTTAGGNSVILTLAVVSDVTTDYLINYIYGSDKLDGSLAQNIEASIDSITIQ